jgi:DNA-binding transcriptional regulator YiaG
LSNPPGFEEEFEPFPDIPGTVRWIKKWTPEEEVEIAAGVEELRRNMSLLRQIREDLGLSQEELAEVLGVSQSNVSKMEARPEPRLSVLSKLVAHKGGRLKIMIEMNGKETEWPFVPAS